MSYPSTITAFPSPTPSSRLNSPSHSTLENLQSSTITQIQAVVGLAGDSSTLGTIIGDVRSPDSNGGGHIQTANKGGTGQISYTKGDILIAQSQSVLSKLAVGTDGLALVADSGQPAGVRWGSFPSPTVRVFTASVATIWNRPSNLSYAIIEVSGAGGGGGGNATNTASGGGAGGYTKITLSKAALPIAASVLAGGGGTAGNTGVNGSVGGLSYFGSLLTATGGLGGTVSNNPGSGGIGAGGDINIRGGGGGLRNNTTTLAGGIGGSNPLGFGSASVLSTGVADGGNYGGGGGGGAATAGGAGGNGVIIIYEY